MYIRTLIHTVMRTPMNTCIHLNIHTQIHFYICPCLPLYIYRACVPKKGTLRRVPRVCVSSFCVLCINVCCVLFDISSHVIQHLTSSFLAIVFAVSWVSVACMPLRRLPGKQQRTRQRLRTRQRSRVEASVQ